MATETLRPNAAGGETGLDQFPSSGENWDKVDEATPDDGSTYVEPDDTGYFQRDLYNLPAHSEGSGTINFIKIYFRCKRDVTGAPAYAKPSLKSNSTVTDGTQVTLTNAWTTYSQQWNTNPADGEAWEWDDIDALQIGVSLKADYELYWPACTQVYVEVDYTAGGEPTEKSSSDSGSGGEDTPIPSAILASSESGAGIEAFIARLLAAGDTGSGADAYVSLQTPAAKSSSDAGSGVEDTPLPSATLASSENGSGIEALIFRLLAAIDTGGGVEASSVEVDGLLKNLFASELGEGLDCLTAKIEMPTKGGGMKLWT
jgi:hypothetical protein